MADSTSKSDFVDIGAILREWARKWYLFVICTAACVGLAYFYTTIKNPVYQVNANLLIAQAEDNPALGLGSLGELIGGNGYVEDEVFVVQSHTVLRQVAKDLKTNKTHMVRDGFLKKHFAYKDFPVELYEPLGIADTLRAVLTFRVNVDERGDITVTTKIGRHQVGKEVVAKAFPVTVKNVYGTFVFNKTPFYISGEPMRTDITLMGFDAAAEVLAKDINFDIASKKSNVIQMSTKTPNIDYGKALLNDIMDVYNQQSKDGKQTQARQTAEFIHTRLAELSGQLEKSDSEVERFKDSEGIVDVKQDAAVNLTRREAIDAKLIEAETMLELAKLTQDFLSEPANDYSVIPVTMDMQPASADPIKQYNELILKRMDMEGEVYGNNPELEKLTAQIDAMRTSIKSSLTHAVKQQSATVDDLKAELEKTRDQLVKVPSQERRYRDILRQQNVREQLYIYLLQRAEETQMMVVSALDKGHKVDEAYALNEAVGMKKLYILVLAFFFGLCLAPVLIYIKRMMRTKFRTREEVENIVDVPVLGEICASQSAKKNPLVVRPKTTSSAAELFRLVRTNLGFMLRSRDGKVVLVTSTKSGEGKSFISINLAASLALLGKKVLLVGMDIRNPKLAEYLDLNPRHGLTEYLSTPGMNVDEIILREPVTENLDIICAGPVPPNPSELLAEQRVDNFIEEMKERYEYVIVDSAPVGMVSDTFALDRLADATVYVCRASYTLIKDLEFVNNIRRQERLKNMAIVINGTAATKGYGYGYHDTSKKAKKRHWWNRRRK